MTEKHITDKQIQVKAINWTGEWNGREETDRKQPQLLRKKWKITKIIKVKKL